MINHLIHRLQLEEIEHGWKCTIFYAHKLVKNTAPGDLPLKAELIITETQLDEGRDFAATSAMYEVGRLLDLELRGQGKNNLDWHMMKDIPDDYMEAHPELKSNVYLRAFAPGKLVWVAENYRD